MKGKLTEKAKTLIQKRMELLAKKQHKEKERLPKLKQKRLANKEDGRGTDWMLRNTTGLGGLKFFQRDTPVKPLLAKAERYYAQWEDLPPDVQEISCGHLPLLLLRPLLLLPPTTS